jgi:hypothetical protein
VPAFLLHQNMQNFSSGLGILSRRLRAYLGLPVPPSPIPPAMPPSWPKKPLAPGSYGFAEIATDLGGPAPLTYDVPVLQLPLCIAGFTELRVAGTGSLALIGRLLTGIGLGGHIYTFRCGRTVGTDHEFLGIMIAGWVNVLAFGRVVINMDELINEYVLPPFPPRWQRETPPLYSGDYRWLIYTVVQLHPRGPKIAVGFLHNTYTLATKAVTAGRIEAMAQRIKANALLPVDHVIIGGDFNVLPRDPRDRSPLYDYSVGTTGSRFKGAWLGGTTWYGSLYDYWRSDIAPDAKVWLVPGGVQQMKAYVSPSNWDGPGGLMSDHAASLLRIV